MKLALALVVLSGCLVGDVWERPTPIDLQSSNKLALNKLALNKLALNKLALDKLVLGAVADSTLRASDALVELERDTADTPDGRSTLVDYVARCALPESAAIAIEDRRYAGGVGVAASWVETGTCDEACQAWMTSCLIAHVNALGVSVAISLRGNHDALAPSTEELDFFIDQEAAFYGNLFVGQDPATTTLENVYACTGWALERDAALAGTTQNGAVWVANAHLAERLCGRRNGAVDACPGIHVVGACGLSIWGSVGPTACDRLTGENTGGYAPGRGVYYDDCYRTHGVIGLRSIPPEPPPPVFHRVITTFLDRRSSGYGATP